MYVCTWNHCSADYCQNFFVLYVFTVNSLCVADTVSFTKFKCVGECGCAILSSNVLSALLLSCTVYISDHIRSWSERRTKWKEKFPLYMKTGFGFVWVYEVAIM